MIVWASGLIPAEADDPAGTPWIGWDNIVTSGSITTDTEEDNFPATNLANPATHLFWRGAFVTAAIENITIVTGTVDELNYVAIAKHNFGSEGITVTLQGKIVGNSPDVWTTIISSFIPDDDLPLIMRFEPTSLSEVRIVLTGGTDVPQAAVVYVGELLVMERGMFIDTDHVPITYGRRNTIVNGMSESGHFTGRIKLKEWRESTAVFENFTPLWYRTNFEPFLEQASETPFFFAWHPITYPLETGYAWLTNDPEPETKSDTERVSFEIVMRGVA